MDPISRQRALHRTIVPGTNGTVTVNPFPRHLRIGPSLRDLLDLGIPSRVHASPVDGQVKASSSVKYYLQRRHQIRLTLSKRRRHPPRMTINSLPDDLLLEIFSHYVGQAKRIRAWYMLVHVCRRWRSLVFSSTHRLHLQILCTARGSVRKLLDVWPDLPIAILDHGLRRLARRDFDNIIAALEHHDRVRRIELWGFSSSILQIFAPVMQEPFPELTYLELLSDGRGAAPILPDPFFGGLAPHLQTVHLKGIPFSPLMGLLLSATDLVDLDLWNIPYYSGFVSAEVIINCIAVMTRLKTFFLGFNSPRSLPDPESQHPPPTTLTVLPALTHFKYRGVSELLEDLVTRIDPPQLENAEITIFNQLILRTPRLSSFISRVNKFRALNHAHVVFKRRYVDVKLSPQTGIVDQAILKMKTSCTALDWQLSSLAQACRWSLPSYAVERLDIREDAGFEPNWEDEIEDREWIEVLRPFTSVKDLCLSEELALRVPLALRELVSATEVVPRLQNIFLEGLQASSTRRLMQEAIRPFISARQISNNPVAVHYQREGKGVVHASGGQ